ncbi:hypothetical protein C5B96_16930 [Subtercola sp. Z020]|uniref:hypothetical protein n=1 Tax=Subtercola sp. Z020 TaxID=2080582 RepID=UPI000CE7700E|nr:hypothetical protein [Subtercola sp. Z020]PPF75265.1 hypothetical protein C5B96_16930 [Subtercola sp. Z020]
MHDMPHASGELLLSRDAHFLDSESDSLRRAAASGRLTRLRRGVYTDSASWSAASPRDRYVRRIHAVVATREVPCVVARQSAAALWSFPRINRWPEDVHLIPVPPGGLRSRNGVRHHAEAMPDTDVAELLGLRVTSRLRTLVDLARFDSIAEAVAALDHSLNPRTAHPHPVVTQDALLEQLVGIQSSRGAARAARAIHFADGGAGSPGESYSRLLIRQLGFAPPQLQVEHPNPRGGSYFTDFEWPDARIIGEFDGRSKYLKPEYLGTRTPGEVVVEEKLREDDLRAEGSQIRRWTWEHLRTPARLERLLSEAGVPRLSRRAAQAAVSSPNSSRVAPPRETVTSHRGRHADRSVSPAPVRLAE